MESAAGAVSNEPSSPEAAPSNESTPTKSTPTKSTPAESAAYKSTSAEARPEEASVEEARSTEPGSGADEDSAREPVRPIVAVGRTGVRIVSIVAIGAHRRCAIVARPKPDSYADLSLRVGQRNHQNRQQCQIFQVPHISPFSALASSKERAGSESLQRVHHHSERLPIGTLWKRKSCKCRLADFSHPWRKSATSGGAYL